MTYKALNTFIDDIFAFVIKMPTMYRLGCFRDDIVFCIFLYQRYIYRVDHSRVNEFGYSEQSSRKYRRKSTPKTNRGQEKRLVDIIFYCNPRKFVFKAYLLCPLMFY